MEHLADSHTLTRTDRPAFEAGRPHIRVVDLFAGCGGLTLGAAQAALDAGMGLQVPLAVDTDASALAVYAANFPEANVSPTAVETYFDADLSLPLTEAERLARTSIGRTDILIGGPPCQGHSDLNNRTRRDDPKNSLYGRMARAAEVLTPSVVAIENVPAVRHDRGNVVDLTIRHLESLGYKVATATVRLDRLGVAQQRRRHVLLASRLEDIEPKIVLQELHRSHGAAEISLRKAIGDLDDIVDPVGYDLPPRASKANMERMEYLLREGVYDLPNRLRPRCHQDEHTYKSMYGRLRWDLPAQTITSGYSSIGQGRYMHPSRPRALTGHEAARIQGFPDYFSFAAATKRAELATMIGNAVPPALGRELVGSIIPALRASAYLEDDPLKLRIPRAKLELISQ